MKDWSGKRWWLVGASEGLGRALAEVMSRAGAELVLSGRDEGRLQALAAGLPGRCRCLPVDVRDSAAVRAAAVEAGPLDGVVYLAGVYWPMSAGAWDFERAEAMADVNFTGGVRVFGAVVPQMLAQGSGHIVVVGSLAGFGGLPGSIGYGSSKAGLMHLAESMQADLRGSGIRVQLANPGFIRTRLTDLNEFRMPSIMEPQDAARRLFDHMQTDRFACSFPAPFAWMFRLGRLLPDWLYFRLFGA